MLTLRGTFKFEVADDGGLLDTPTNNQSLRKLWLDRSLINGEDLGPGNAGDFDDGAWHVACHLLGAGGVRQLRDGRMAWLEISHDPTRDEYFASVTAARNGRAETSRVDEVRDILDGSALLGFVEGNSTGHISARGVNDPPTRFNKWQRQDFDQPASGRGEGGKVWEHWCTVRKIRNPDATAASALRAYVSLVAALGDRFAPTVARGRREFGHPEQLSALVKAGFTSAASATWDTMPLAIPDAADRALLEARPADALAAVTGLQWDTTAPAYYMFKRRIARWSSAQAVRDDLRSS